MLIKLRLTSVQSMATGSTEPTGRAFGRQHVGASVWGEAGQKVYDHLPLTQAHAAGLHQRERDWPRHQRKQREKTSNVATRLLTVHDCKVRRLTEPNLSHRSSRSSCRCLCWTCEKAGRCRPTSMWTWTMRKCARCCAAPLTEQAPRDRVWWRTAWVLPPRGSQETVTSAWTWTVGYVSPNR